MHEQMYEQIEKWYKAKTKIYNIEDIKYLQKYLVKTDQNISHVERFSSDYKFDYFSLDEMNCKKIKVRPENIFKINLYRIMVQLRTYFSDINLEIFFETSGENDKMIKKDNCTFKHDVYIKLHGPNSFYDIGLEYFETKHDRIKDNDKDISSKINLDVYRIYNEKDNKYIEFMKEIIYSLFLGICTLNDNPYMLAKINYFKNSNDIKLKKLQKDTDIFNTIIKYMKANVFNLKNFFEDAVLTNPDTEEEFELDKFIEYLMDNFRIKIIFLNSNYDCEYKYFVNIIMNIGVECSDIISSYRNIYSKTMEILFESEREILNWMKEANKSRRLVPKYLDYFLLNHVQNYKCQHTLEKVCNSLNIK